MRENFSSKHIKEVISAQLEKRLKATGGKKKKERATQDEDSDGGPTSATRQTVREQVRLLFLTCAFVTLDATC